MAAIDLVVVEGFSNSEDEMAGGGVGDESAEDVPDSGEEDLDSSGGEGDGGWGSELCDYSQLELAQRARARGRGNPQFISHSLGTRRGAWGGAAPEQRRDDGHLRSGPDHNVVQPQRGRRPLNSQRAGSRGTWQGAGSHATVSGGPGSPTEPPVEHVCSLSFSQP